MNLEGRSVLVTGGTGSFGKKFVEVCLREHNPRKLIVFSRDELKQDQMRRRFPDVGDSPMRYFIGDVRDRERLYRALDGVDIVVHAAALKQVPACEYNPLEAIKTNIEGAANLIDAAIDRGVQKIIALSTDKAVNPVNLYGATKLCAERLFVQANAYSGGHEARFSCVRYGNVVGSRGSVIPLFLEQRKQGKITITDPHMTRFWITLEQGVRFVIRSVERMTGAEVIVPKLPTMNIVDLAKVVAPDCEIEYIGIRPGEKIHEVLISEDDARHTLELDDSFVVAPLSMSWDGAAWDGARPVASEFRYSSDSAAWRLTAAELAEMVDDLVPLPSG